jgi:hypothetical protein
MIMPGRSWVAGIDIAGNNLLHSIRLRFADPAEGGQATFSAAQGLTKLFYTQVGGKETFPEAALIVRGPQFVALG